MPKPPKKGELTTKQQRFVDAYDGNATQAALAAGYSPKTAAAIGKENLQKPLVINAIKARQWQEAIPTIKTRQQRQQFWSDMMSDKTLDPKARLKASELLGKSEADFTENLNVRIGLEDKLKALPDDEVAARIAALEAAIKK